MANHVSHGSLPYPIKNARFTVLVPYLDADGDPTDPTTPDSEVSQDGGAFADAAEEVSTITGSNGTGYITLSGAEMNNSLVAVAFKVASGPKATLMTLYPRNLPILASGTASAGAAGTITLASSITYDLTGCFVRTTGGTGGGGTGGASNQARRITAYNSGTQVATVTPNWETTPDNTTTYDILLPEGVTAQMAKALIPTTAGRTLDVSSGGEAGVDWANVGSPTTTVGLSGTTVKTATDVETDTQDIQARIPAALVSGRIDASVGAMAAGVVTAAAIAADAITDAKVAADVTIASVTGAVGSVTGAVTVGTNNDKTGYALSAAGVQAIWDALTSALTTVGSVGKRIADYLDAAVSSRGTGTALDAAGVRAAVGLAAANLDTQLDAIPTAAENADAVWDEAIAGHAGAGSTGEALAAAGSAGDPWTTALPGAYGAGTAGKIVGDNLNATVSSRASQASVDTIDDYVDSEVAAIKAKTDLIPAAPAAVGDIPTAAAVADAVWDEATSGHVAAGSTGKALTDANNGTPPTAAAIRTEMDANSTKLANLDATVASRLAAASYTAPLDAAGTRSAVGLAAANLDTQLDALPTATENADALLKRDWTAVTGEAARSVLNALRALRNRVAISSGTLTVYKEDDATSAWTGAVTTAAGDPVSEVDPS